MKNSPLVSIVMNCYNSDEFLEETLISVINQTYQNWELIFWDNQSNDNSSVILHKYSSDSRIKYFFAPKHTPLGEARNLAVKESSGEWLAFLDCDDLWDEDKLERQLESASKEPNVYIIYSLFKILTSKYDKNDVLEMQKTYGKFKIEAHDTLNIYPKLLEQNYIIFSSLLIKRQLYIDVGGINPDYIQNEDYELLLKASLISNAICIDSSAVSYRIHLNNASHSNSERNFIETKDIYLSLPKSKMLSRALKRNATRYSFYEFRKRNYKKSLNIFIHEGSFYEFIKLVYNNLHLYIKKSNK